MNYSFLGIICLHLYLNSNVYKNKSKALALSNIKKVNSCYNKCNNNYSKYDDTILILDKLLSRL